MDGFVGKSFIALVRGSILNEIDLGPGVLGGDVLTESVTSSWDTDLASCDFFIV